MKHGERLFLWALIWGVVYVCSFIFISMYFEYSLLAIGNTGGSLTIHMVLVFIAILVTFLVGHFISKVFSWTALNYLKLLSGFAGIYIIVFLFGPGKEFDLILISVDFVVWAFFLSLFFRKRLE